MILSLEINLIFSISHQIYVPLISNRGCQRTLLNYIICPAKLQSTGRFVIFGYNIESTKIRKIHRSGRVYTKATVAIEL